MRRRGKLRRGFMGAHKWSGTSTIAELSVGPTLWHLSKTLCLSWRMGSRSLTGKCHFFFLMSAWISLFFHQRSFTEWLPNMTCPKQDQIYAKDCRLMNQKRNGAFLFTFMANFFFLGFITVDWDWMSSVLSGAGWSYLKWPDSKSSFSLIF